MGVEPGSGGQKFIPTTVSRRQRREEQAKRDGVVMQM